MEFSMLELVRMQDAALRARAQKVVPGGMWGHLNAAKLPDRYPQFFSHGEGGLLWDVDGNRYVDFMCSWGPNLLGHKHPEVEEAAERQRRMGDCLNGPAEVMVELAELVVDTISHADWTMFQKNGTDATTTCVTVARAATGKRKILVAKGAYHGAVPWCSPSLIGVTAEDRAHLAYYTFNDIESLEDAVNEAGDDIAAIVVSAYRHDMSFDQELPTQDFARAVRRLADAKGAAVILDEVRTGFRLHTAGSWEPLGVSPDLSAWSKAIANGYALSAVTGSDWLRKAASQVFVTGSFWAGAVSMAAALATLKVVRRDNVPDKIARLGQMLRDGLETRSRQFGLSIRQSGPAQMPTVLFDDDADFAKGYAFCNATLAKGVYFHPRHNMFLCAAHTEADIAVALEAAEHGFATVAKTAPN
jgi:glutamate-1-semialdehyde 2,1-aminomutase